MNEEQKLDALWLHVDDIIYNSQFGEMILQAEAARWRVVDSFANIAVAVTTSGSAVAAWKLWETPAGRSSWAILAGVASLLAIVHAVLTVSAKVESSSRGSLTFRAVALRMETLKRNIERGWEFDDAELSFKDLESAYNQAQEQAPVPSLVKKRAMRLLQDELDRRWSQD